MSGLGPQEYEKGISIRRLVPKTAAFSLRLPFVPNVALRQSYADNAHPLAVPLSRATLRPQVDLARTSHVPQSEPVSAIRP